MEQQRGDVGNCDERGGSVGAKRLRTCACDSHYTGTISGGIGGGHARMQPVYVGDVASAVADAVDGKTRPGATYELGGPEVLTMREIMQMILDITDRDRMLVPLPFELAKLKALFLQFAPGALKLTPDQVELLKSDKVVSDAARDAGLTLQGLGITPDSMEAICPQYLWRFRPMGQFQRKDA